MNTSSLSTLGRWWDHAHSQTKTLRLGKMAHPSLTGEMERAFWGAWVPSSFQRRIARGQGRMRWPMLSVVPGLTKILPLHEPQFSFLQVLDDAGGFPETCHSNRPEANTLRKALSEDGEGQNWVQITCHFLSKSNPRSLSLCIWKCFQGNRTLWGARRYAVSYRMWLRFQATPVICGVPGTSTNSSPVIKCLHGDSINPSY